MKIFPQISRSEMSSLAFKTTLEIAAGGVATAALLRWILA